MQYSLYVHAKFVKLKIPGELDYILVQEYNPLDQTSLIQCSFLSKGNQFTDGQMRDVQQRKVSLKTNNLRRVTARE